MAHTPPFAAPDLLQRAGERRVFLPALAGLVVLYLAASLYHLAEIPLIDPDEPRYAAASRTIAREASFSRPETILIPMFNGKARINKPPLFYWLVAASDRLAGTASEASARAPSIAMGLLLLLTTVFLGRRVFGNAVGLLAGLVLLSCPIFIAMARACTTDMTLSAFAAAALAFLMLAMLELSPPRRATWLAALFLGLAVLTKATPALAVALVLILERALALPMQPRTAAPATGAAPETPRGGIGRAAWEERPGRLIPVLLLLAAAASAVAFYIGVPWLDTLLSRAALACSAAIIALLVWLAWRAPRGALAQMPWGRAFGVAILMGLWWYAALIHIKGWTEFRNLLEFEVGQRLTGSMHREPMHYYIPNLLAGAFPWSIGLAAAIGAAWPRAAAGADRNPHAAADRFLLAWLLGIVLFFSIPGAKLATYILPAMPAFAILIARLLVRLAKDDAAIAPVWKAITLGLAVLAGILIACVPLCVRFCPHEFREFAAAVPFTSIALQFALAVAGAWALACLQRAVVAALLLAGSVLVLTLVLTPAASHGFLEPRSTKPLCRDVLPQIADCERFASVGAEIESLSYYLDRTIQESRRRRVAQRRKDAKAAGDDVLPPGTPDEPYDAVIREEMSRPETVALFVQIRYYARAIGKKVPEFEALSRDEIERSVPPYARFVGANQDLVVITNKNKPR